MSYICTRKSVMMPVLVAYGVMVTQLILVQSF